MSDVMPASTWTAILAAAAVSGVAYLLWTRRRPSNLPPGPQHIPFIGNVLSIEDPYLHRQFLKWGKQYGPIFTASFGNHHVVVLNEFNVIKEALVKNSVAFAGRPFTGAESHKRSKALNPHSPLTGIIDSSHSPEWKKQRSLALQILRYLGYGKSYTEDQIKEEAACLVDVFKTHGKKPINPALKINTSVANIICSLLFGERYNHDDEEFVTLLRTTEDLFEGASKHTEIDFVPLLQLAPTYKKTMSDLERTAKEMHDFLGQKIEERRKRVDDLGPEGPRDFIECYLKELSMIGEDKGAKIAEDWLPVIVADFFQAGAETTATTLTWALLWMAKYPEVQKMVQAQLDELAGKTKYEFKLSDRENLPYIEATLMEIQRISNIVPLAIEHQTTQDVVIHGYRLPKDTHIYVNLTAVLKSPTLWPKPNVLRPERFLDEDGQIMKKEEWVPFSMGRRMCLGEQLARQEFFIFFTSLLHSFDVKLADATAEHDMDGVWKFVLKPPAYDVIMTPRF